MPKYVVLDENNKWLYYGEAENPTEALLHAKESTLYDINADIYVFKIVEEKEYPAHLHATLKPEDIEVIISERRKLNVSKVSQP